MSTGINIAPSSDITVGTTAVTSGTNGRVFFQAGGVVQQDGAFNWNNTNKRLGIGVNATSPTAALFLRTNTLVANDVVTIQNGQYGNEIFRVRDNATASASTIGSIFLGARIYSSAGVNTNQFDIGGYGLGGSYGDFSSNSVWLNNQGNVGDGTGSSVISVSSNFYVNLQTTKKYKFEAVTGNFGIGNVGTLGARLDVRAQGALSTDIAFRVRNSADTLNIFDVQGDGVTNVRSRIICGFSGMTSTGGALHVYAGNSSDNVARFFNTSGLSFLNIRTSSNGGVIELNDATGAAGVTLNGIFSNAITLADSRNIVFGTGAGTKIASATNQKIAFWNATPIVQPTTAVAASTFVTNTSLIANDSATFDGYTIGQVVKALRNLGILA